MRTIVFRLSPLLLLVFCAAGAFAAEPASAPASCAAPLLFTSAAPEPATTDTTESGALFVRLLGQNEPEALAKAADHFTAASCICGPTCYPVFVCNCRGPAACCASCCAFAC